jgi:hypothetical protein
MPGLIFHCRLYWPTFRLLEAEVQSSLCVAASIAGDFGRTACD